jgi:hypothetical protein
VELEKICPVEILCRTFGMVVAFPVAAHGSEILPERFVVTGKVR